MSDTEGLSESHKAILEAGKILEGPSGGVQDVDPSAWLEQPSEMNGTVEVDGVRLKVAALTEDETQRLMKQNSRPPSTNPTGPPVLDAMRFRLAMIVYSLNKANNTQLTPNQLGGRKTGSLTKIQDAIMALSGMGETQATAAFLD